MESIICNKCFIPKWREKQPYSLLQCGHISCQNCLKQVGPEQCPQCQCTGVVSLPLKEPLVPQVASFFMPFDETLEMLFKVALFRENQMNITMQRFFEMDKKYEAMKIVVIKTRRALKAAKEEYMNLKAKREKLCKKLSDKTNNQQPLLCAKTPASSNIFIQPTMPRYSLQSLDFLIPASAAPKSSVKSSKQHKTIDDIFNNRQINPSSGSIFSESVDSAYYTDLT